MTDRIDELEARVAKLERKRDSQIRCEQRVINLAREYARVKMLGCVKDDMGRVVIQPSDRERYADAHLYLLADAAVNLLRADSDVEE